MSDEPILAFEGPDPVVWTPVDDPVNPVPKDGRWVMLTGSAEVGGWAETEPYGSGGGGKDGHPGFGVFRWSEEKFRDQWDDYYGPQYPTHWAPCPKAMPIAKDPG